MTPPPSPDKPSGGGPRPKLPTRPDLPLNGLTPDQPERQVVRHSGVDGAPQELPAHRKGTLTGLGAIRPPSGEYAATLPAPKDPPLKKTWRLPTPPSAVAKARRTDPPVTAEPPPEETTLQSSLAASTEAPPSADQASLAAVRAERDRLREALAEAERRARVQTEARSPGPLELPVTPSERPASVTKAPESTAASEGSTRALRSALTKLVLGIAALLALLGIPLTAYIQALTTQIQRSTNQAAQATNAADAAKAKAGTNAAEQTDLEKRFRQYRANQREVWRLLGVEVPKHEGDPDPIDLKPMTPHCPPGKVCPGPQLVLTNAP